MYKTSKQNFAVLQERLFYLKIHKYTDNWASKFKLNLWNENVQFEVIFKLTHILYLCN